MLLLVFVVCFFVFIFCGQLNSYYYIIILRNNFKTVSHTRKLNRTLKVFQIETGLTTRMPRQKYVTNSYIIALERVLIKTINLTWSRRLASHECVAY